MRCSLPVFVVCHRQHQRARIGFHYNLDATHNPGATANVEVRSAKQHREAINELFVSGGKISKSERIEAENKFVTKQFQMPKYRRHRIQ